MYTGFTDNSHEIRIAIPAGQNVEMDVSGDASTCHGADIEAEIETVAIVDTSDVFFGKTRVAHEFDPVCFGQVFNSRNMERGRNHEMPVRIGK